MHVLITRPEDDATPLAAALHDAGVQSTTEPLLKIVYLDKTLPDLSEFQGLLITSANGIRAFARRDKTRNLAVWAVGDASARTARELGFANVRSASGDVSALAERVRLEADSAAGPFLHVAGTKLAGDLAGQLADYGFGYERCVLYRAEPATHLSNQTQGMLSDGSLSGVMLYSPRTAAAFVDLIKAANLSGALKTMTAFCLSAAVAEKIADLAWYDIAVAPAPDEASLIAKVLEAATKV